MRRYGFDGYKVQDDEAAVIEEMARRVLLGESCRPIAADLNARGVLTSTSARARESGEADATSGKWSGAAVADILRRPANAGLREHRGEILGRAAWPAILEEETWRAVERHFKNRASSVPVTTRRTWLLSGLALCGSCGETMGTTGKSGPYARTVYRCRGRVNAETGKLRHCLTRKADDLDDYVAAQIVARLARDDARDLLTEDSQAVRAAAEKAETLRLRIEQLKQEFTENDDTMSPSDLRKMLGRLKERLAEAEALAVPSPRRPLLEGLIGDEAGVRWEGLDMASRRAIVAEMLDVVVLPIDNRVYNKGFNPAYVRLVWRDRPQDAT